LLLTPKCMKRPTVTTSFPLLATTKFIWANSNTCSFLLL
jgi:hypothetical protein